MTLRATNGGQVRRLNYQLAKPRDSDHQPIGRQWSYHGCGYRTGVIKLGEAANAGSGICRHDSSGKYIQRCRPHAPAIMQH